MLEEPLFKSLPSKEDFYYDGDCDERYAIEWYLGKDLEYTTSRYYKYSPLSTIQDLYFIGINAFRYYILGACRYLQNIDTDDKYMIDDASNVYCALVDIFDTKFKSNPKEMEYIASYVKEFSKWAIKNYEFFDIDEEVYGNVKEKWQELIKKVEELYGI